MKKHLLAGLAASALLAGCGGNGEPSGMYGEFASEEAMADMETVERVTTVDIAEPGTDGATGNGEIPVSIPQIAYTYEYGFRISGDEMPALQARHVAMCEELGPQGCRVIEMRSSGGEGDYASGYLQLAVAAELARDFGNQLAATTEAEGGNQTSASITGEDLSKQIVDTEARLRARILLRDRLMEVLRTRTGSVAELVEAERGVAQVNEEIDQAQSWLAEMRGRVNFSRVDVSYQSGTPSGGGFMEPVRNAFGSLGEVMGYVVATLIMLLAVVGPFALLVWGGLALRRRLKKPVEAKPDGEA